jgi:hypothetical protein
MACFNVGSMTALSNTQLLAYSNATSIFLRVQAFNQNIRTRRLAGATGISYYSFIDGTEATLYRQGQFILTENNPTGAAAGLYNDVVQI